MSKAVISVITPCYNEEGNAELIYERVRQIFTERRLKNETHQPQELTKKGSLGIV
jgi:hypothetical protein